ncbi:aminoglycoside phosphotransferase [Kribbella sp. NPDC056951]|uniref:aminoglycoside phosphotransferase n=1 Tax=Kribbella sp. NPDC056951 TaxID=3345978 RepID=UPI0036448199
MSRPDSSVALLGSEDMSRRLVIMTKQGSFKRAVRRHAERTGQRYTEARADLELAETQAFVHDRPFEHESLTAHLEARYGIRITSLASIDDDPKTRPRDSWPGHYPATLLVKRADGPPWIARIFSSPADQVSRVEGDAEILRFLAAHDFPAERVAHEEPVSVYDGSGVIVTEFVEGGRPDGSTIQRELGSLLGRLHSLPPGEGAVARAGGSDESGGGRHVGRPKEDLAAAMSFLVSVEDSVGSEGRESFEWLRDRVENADDGEGLPEAFTHGNYHAWSAVGTPGDLVIVGWAGSGRGPRLPALAWLLTTAAEADLALVDEVVRGYSEHVQLTDEEIDRLPQVLDIKPVWLGCIEYRQAVLGGTTPTLEAGWPAWAADRSEHNERIAARAVAALHR